MSSRVVVCAAIASGSTGERCSWGIDLAFSASALPPVGRSNPPEVAWHRPNGARSVPVVLSFRLDSRLSARTGVAAQRDRDDFPLPCDAACGAPTYTGQQSDDAPAVMTERLSPGGLPAILVRAVWRQANGFGAR